MHGRVFVMFDTLGNRSILHRVLTCDVMVSSEGTGEILIRHTAHESRVIRKIVFGFPTKSDTNLAVQAQKIAGGLNFRIHK